MFPDTKVEKRTMESPCTKCSYPVDEESSKIHDEGDTTLILSAYNGHVKCVKAWIQAGADVNAITTCYKQTPLFHAAKTGHDECLLIEAGADVVRG